MTRAGLAAWLRRQLPIFVGLIALVGLAGVALQIGAASLRSAEHGRLTDRTRLVEGFASYARTAYDTRRVAVAVDATPLTPQNPSLDALLIQQFQTTPTGDPNDLVALLDRQGRPVAMLPETAPGVTPADLGPAWQQALSGQSAESNVFNWHGAWARAVVVPVGGAQPWGVLVTVQRSATTTGQRFFEGLGAFEGKDGGFLSLDSRGVVLFAWDPKLLGRQLFTPEQLRPLQGDQVVVRTTGTGDDQLTTLGVGVRDGYNILFQQPTRELFGDLRTRQKISTIGVVAVLVVSMVGLAVFWRRREQAARRGQARLDALLSHTTDLVLVVSAEGLLSFVSPAATRLLGLEPTAFQGRRLAELVHPEDLARVGPLLTGEAGSAALNVRLRTATGDPAWFDLRSSRLTGDAGLSGILLTCHPAGERKRLQDWLSYQAHHDALTGLLNRDAFTVALERATRLASGTPESGRGGSAVLFIDLDRFKPVNDTFGHEGGDLVLRVLGQRLAGAVRGADRAFDAVARFGGDEFAVLLSPATPSAAAAVADQLQRVIGAPITLGATSVTVGASIGVAVVEGYARPERLLRAADQAMYQAKTAGGVRAVMVSVEPELPVGDGPADAAPSGASEPMGAAGNRREPTAPVAATTWLPPRSASVQRWRRWRRTARHLVPLLVAALAVSGVAGLSLIDGRRSMAAAERQRIAERLAVTQRIATYSGDLIDPRLLLEPMSKVPWSFDKPSENLVVLNAISRLPFAGPNSQLVLARLDATPITAFPANAALPFRASDSYWQQAVRGQPVIPPVRRVAGRDRIYVLVPILRTGQPMAILVISESLPDAAFEDYMSHLGSLGSGTGGLSVVDETGLVAYSWNPRLIGTRLLSSSTVRGLPPVGPQRVPALSKSDVALAAVIPHTGNTRYAIVFDQPTDVFFADLRSGQLARDLSQLALVAATVALLTLVNWRRARSLRRSEQRLEVLLQHAHDILLVIGASAEATYISPAVRTLLGYDPQALLGRSLRSLIHPQDRPRVRGWLRGQAPAGVPLHEVRLRASNGNYVWFDLSAADLRSAPAVAGLLVTCHEIGERKALHDRLRYQAGCDPLTGLPNRAAFTAYLDACFEGLRADPGHFGQLDASVAVLFVDLDHFKPINDRYGHAVGDEVLRVVAARVSNAVRRGDVVCRLGGDEFAVLLTDADEATARQIAERVLVALRRPVMLSAAGTLPGGEPLRLDATIGIAVSGQREIHPEALVRAADLAMYEAKEAGRGRYALAR